MENKNLDVFLADWLDSQSGVVNFLNNDGDLGGLVTIRSKVRLSESGSFNAREP